MNDNWFSTFFQGMTLDVWKEAMTQEMTADEAVFIANNLNAPQGSSLLDVPCGQGRLSRLLSEMGFKTKGIDSCAQFIEEAKRLAHDEASGACEFILGDMRKLPWSDEFAGAFCFGNSFGFFDEQETRLFLDSLCTALKHQGRLLIDTLMVAETFLTNGSEREWQRIGDLYMLVENDYDCRKSIVKSTYTYIDSKTNASQTKTAFYHVYSSGQICRMLEDTGFKVVDLFGSVDEDPYRLGADRLLLVAEKQ